MFFKALCCTWKQFTDKDKGIVRSFCLELVLNNEVPELLDKLTSNDTLKDIFDDKDLQFIKRNTVQLEIPDILTGSNWDVFEFTGTRKKTLKYSNAIFICV